MASSPPAKHDPLPAAGTLEARLKRERNPVVRLFMMLGPGLITGASDDDPSGIGTYATAGASMGYATLWLAWVTFPLMAAVQYICAKVGLVTGRGLAGVLREHYPKALLYPVVLLLLIANTINAGVDIGAIGAGLNLLIPIPILVYVPIVAVLILALQIWGSYRLIARTFKWLTLALFAYIGSALYARPDFLAVLRGTFIPTVSFDAASLAMLVGILGTTISPYLFFWQASQEVEEKKALRRKRLWRRKGATDNELSYAAWDVNIGMLFSNVVMYFIILATAATLWKAGRTDIQTAADAAEALRPLAGNAAYLLMTLGLVGSGVLAVPILTGSSAYAVCEAFHWKHGLDQKCAKCEVVLRDHHRLDRGGRPHQLRRRQPGEGPVLDGGAQRPSGPAAAGGHHAGVEQQGRHGQARQRHGHQRARLGHHGRHVRGGRGAGRHWGS